MRSSGKTLSFASLLLCLLFLSGCASTSVQRENLVNKKIAATAAIPPVPFVQHLMLASAGIYPHDPHGRPPAGPARSEHRTAERIDSNLRQAAQQVDVGRRVAEQVLVGIAHDFGAAVSPEVDTADYILDVQLLRYGLVMRTTQQVPSFYVELDAVLKESATDTIVWRERLEHDRFYTQEHLTGEQWAQASAKLLAEELKYLAEQISVHLMDDIQRAAR